MAEVLPALSPNGSFSMAAELERLGAIRDGGLHLPPDLPYERYVAIGAWLGHFDDLRNWLIADWLIYGEHTYGTKFEQAAEILGLHPQSLMNIQRVGRKIPPQRRRLSVKFTTHEEVAKLSPNDQRRLLKRAETERLTKMEVRRIVRGETQEQYEDVTQELCEACGRPLP